MRELEEVAIAFHRACAAADIQYAFVGGIAVIAWGQPRATIDIDALVDMDPERTGELGRAFREEGFDVKTWELEAALEDGSHVTLFDPGSDYHVDIKPTMTPEERAEVQRVQHVDFHGEELAFAAPEDVIAFKLDFGTPQDRQDARSILARQWETLDHEELEQRAEKLGAAEALSELKSEIRSSLEEG